MSDRDLPPLLAMDDKLDRLEREAETDIHDEVVEIRARLDEYADSEGDGRASLLDDVDNDLSRIREQVSGKAARQAEALQNRVEQFRDSRAGSSETLSLVDPRLEHQGVPVDVGTHGSDQLDVVATVVNAGETTDGVVRAGFYSDDGALLRRVDVYEPTVSSGEKREVTATVTAPPGVAHYDVTVVDADVATRVTEA